MRHPRPEANEWRNLSSIGHVITNVCCKWLQVLARPSVSTFAGEVPYATWEQVRVGLALLVTLMVILFLVLLIATITLILSHV